VSSPLPASLPVPAEADGFAAFYREHHAFVWRNARRLGCDDEWVDDAVHEVFLVAARRLREFAGDSSLRTWLFAILFRVVQRMQRDRARYRARIRRYSEVRAGDSAASVEERSEAAEYLRHLLSRLDEQKRVVVILIELEGMTSAEVGRALEIPQGTVDSRLRAARRQLEKMMERDRTALERRSR
jgi:RNA polymerase sigma-70 factor (ECF subfamily)